MAALRAEQLKTLRTEALTEEATLATTATTSRPLRPSRHRTEEALPTNPAMAEAAHRRMALEATVLRRLQLRSQPTLGATPSPTGATVPRTAAMAELREATRPRRQPLRRPTVEAAAMEELADTEVAEAMVAMGAAVAMGAMVAAEATTTETVGTAGNPIPSRTPPTMPKAHTRTAPRATLRAE